MPLWVEASSSSTLEMTVSEAWAIWGRGNGASNELELLQRVQSYRDSKNHEPVPDPTIGCVILRSIFFADLGRELPQPPNWSPNNVTIEGYETVGPGR